MLSKKNLVAINKLPPLWSSLIRLFVQIAMLLATVIFAQYSGSLLMAALLGIATATRLRALNNIVHECAHNHFTKGRKWNIRIGEIISPIFFTTFQNYKVVHMTHHAHLGDYQRDLDFEHVTKMQIEDEVSPWPLLRKAPRALLHYALVPRTWTTANILTVLVYATVLFMLIVTQNHLAMICLSATLLCWFPLSKWLYDVVDHGGIYSSGSELLRSRNFIIENRVVRALLFPSNDCYHLVHHLYPFLAVACFEEAHACLSNDSEYARLAHRWNELDTGGVGQQLTMGNVEIKHSLNGRNL